MRNFLFPRCGIIFSSVLIVFGLFFLFVFPSVFQFFSNKEFLLSKSSQSFKHWRRTPIPVYMDVFFFNWTNPEDINTLGVKPSFTELGPYRFYEKREKVNLTWYDSNNTITYRQLRSWHFNPEESNGTLEDEVTSLNAVSLTAAFKNHKTLFFDAALKWTGQKVFVTNTLQSLLFDGYEDTLMTVASVMKTSPFDKFAWLYKKNASYEADGWFNLETGAKDISSLGMLRQWNHKNHTGFYESSCDQVKGFTGDMFPPGQMGKDTKFHLFSQDLCRPVPLSYKEDVEVRGIQGHKYTTRLQEEDASTNSCFCSGDCVPSGLLNLTSCRYGAPVFVSLPHFYGARRHYVNTVRGLRPQKEKHEFYMTVEPTFGIPVDVSARVQLNMFLQPFERISLYKSVPKVMFPILWIDQRVRITEPLAWELRMVILVPTLATVAGVFSLSLGTLLFIVTRVLLARSRRLDSTLTKADAQILTSGLKNGMLPATPVVPRSSLW